MFKRLINYLSGKPAEPNLWPNPLPQHRWHISWRGPDNMHGHFQMTRPSEDFEAREFTQKSLDFAMEYAANSANKSGKSNQTLLPRDIIITSIAYLGWMTDKEWEG